MPIGSYVGGLNDGKSSEVPGQVRAKRVYYIKKGNWSVWKWNVELEVLQVTFMRAHCHTYTYVDSMYLCDSVLPFSNFCRCLDYFADLSCMMQTIHQFCGQCEQVNHGEKTAAWQPEMTWTHLPFKLFPPDSMYSTIQWPHEFCPVRFLFVVRICGSAPRYSWPMIQQLLNVATAKVLARNHCSQEDFANVGNHNFIQFQDLLMS